LVINLPDYFPARRDGKGVAVSRAKDAESPQACAEETFKSGSSPLMRASRINERGVVLLALLGQAHTILGH
jgi:hypothetical protein